MNDRKTTMMTILVVLLSAATVGYVLAQRPNPNNIAPYIGPDKKITTHEWARDQAIAYLNLAPSGVWVETDITPTETLGTSVILFESGDLSITVSHCLNPAADYFVDVTYLEESWRFTVSQMGECTLIE